MVPFPLPNGSQFIMQPFVLMGGRSGLQEVSLAPPFSHRATLELPAELGFMGYEMKGAFPFKEHILLDFMYLWVCNYGES